MRVKGAFRPCLQVAGLKITFVILAAGTASAQCPSDGCPPDNAVTQDVTVTNTVHENHSETHSNNGGLSSRGGRIVLGPSTARSQAEQAGRNAQSLRVAHRREQSSRRRAARSRERRSIRTERQAGARQRAALRQAAGLTNWVHNNSAATSANTGESSTDASTTTGSTNSDVSSTQVASNEQSIEIG